MSIVIDTPEGIAFAKAAARASMLSLEIKGMKRSSGRQTAYSIVKEVYGFRGNRQSVLDDLNEYIEAELRLRKLDDAEYKAVVADTQFQIDHLIGIDKCDQPHFETAIAQGEEMGYITHEHRQAMSDLFYVTIVRQNAGGK